MAMRLPTILSCATLVLGPTLGCSQPPVPEILGVFRGGSTHQGAYPEANLSSGHGKVAWSFATGGPVRSSPLVHEDRLYVGSGDGHLYALDAGTGEEIWRFNSQSPVHSSPALRTDLVFFGDRENRFYALDRESGRLRWRVETGPDKPWEWGHEGWDYFTSSPVLAAGFMVVGSGDGAVYAFEAATGSRAWRIETGARIRSSPAVSGETVFVGSADGFLYAIDLHTGELRWRFGTEGVANDAASESVDRKTIQSSPAVVAGVVYFGSRDGHVYAVDAGSGQEIWRSEGRMPWFITSPAVAAGMVFNGNSDGLFVNALDAATGQEQWRTPTGQRVFSSPAFHNGVLYAGNHAGRLMALDARTGATRWELRLPEGILSSPVPAAGRIYLGCDDGGVYAVQTQAGAPPARAVYWDEERLPWSLRPDHEEVRDHFVSRGYAVVDQDGLARLMAEADAPSVVVFAMDDVPPTVATNAADTPLTRRYLASGGKMVWLGLPPFYVDRDDSGSVLGVNREGPEVFLDVGFGAYDMDRYAAVPTSEGLQWGLDEWWMGWSGVMRDRVSTVLATEEKGGASAWVKSFGGPNGSGFVFLWGTYLPPPREFYSTATAVAEYGLGRVAGGS